MYTKFYTRKRRDIPQLVPEDIPQLVPEDIPLNLSTR